MPLHSIRKSIADFISPVETKSAVATLDDWGLAGFIGPNTVAGASVTAKSAMRVPAVSAAVSLISSALGTLPAKLYRQMDGSKEVASDNPSHRLVHRAASDMVSAGALRRQLTQDALLTGNGYALANRGASSGRVVEFVRVSPNAMSVETDDYGNATYKLTTANGIRALAARDVLHLPALFSHDGLSGEAPIVLAREAIALALLMEQHGGKLFKNGARPSLAVSYPSDATKAGVEKDGSTVRKNLIAATRAGLEGVDNAGRAAILFDGASISPFAFSSVDAQFLEMRRFAIDEIARAFRVPPHMLFEMGRATWGNSEEMGRQFLQLTLLPWIEAWQDAYARCLLDPETDDDLSIEFIVDDLLRADTSTRFEAYSKAIAARILNPNEVRAMENRAPYAGGETYANPNTTAGASSPSEDKS